MNSKETFHTSSVPARFFPGLQTFSGYREIFKAHLQKRGRLPSDINLHLLTQSAESRVDYGIEQLRRWLREERARSASFTDNGQTES